MGMPVTFSLKYMCVYGSWGAGLAEKLSHHLSSVARNWFCQPIVVQSLSCVQVFATPWTAACQASLSSTISQSLLKFMSIESVMLSNYLILCCPTVLLPSIFPSIRDRRCQFTGIFSDSLVLGTEKGQWCANNVIMTYFLSALFSMHIFT